MRKRGGVEVFEISGARRGLTADVRGRQRRYAISMSIRTVCFLLAVALWHVQVVVAAVFMVLGGVLPYVAVVIANAGRTDHPTLPPAFVPPSSRYMLDPGSDPRSVDEADPADESPSDRPS